MRESDRFAARLRGKLTKEQLASVMEAYRFAKEAHRGQKRDGGERYFEHPKNVALILINELRHYDSEMIAAELLHDVPESRPDISWQELEQRFGKGTYHLVRMMTKEKWLSEEEERQYFAAFMFYEWRERIVKLCDRLDNIRSLAGCTAEKQRRNLDETYEFFIPLAEKTHPYLFAELSKACAQAESALAALAQGAEAK